MNNEPVAWMKEVEGGTMYTNYEYPGSIPLYTHPAKTLTDDPLVNFKPVWQEKPELTLTDEEIDMLAHEYNCIDDYPHEFVRVCIRKAQEK